MSPLTPDPSRQYPNSIYTDICDLLFNPKDSITHNKTSFNISIHSLYYAFILCQQHSKYKYSVYKNKGEEGKISKSTNRFPL